MDRDEAISRLQQHEADLKRLDVTQAPSFAALLLAMPHDDCAFWRDKVRMRDLSF